MMDEMQAKIYAMDQSSNVARISHSEATENEIDLMTVEFRNGGKYVYYGVPLDVYRMAEDSISIGKFLNTIIKPNYESEKIPDGVE